MSPDDSADTLVFCE